MNKFVLLSGSDKKLLDTIVGEIKKKQECYIGDYLSIKKMVLVQLETNSVTSCWKFTKQYQGLKYLNLI